MSKWSRKAIKCAKLKLIIIHKFTRSDYLLLNKLIWNVCDKNGKERSSVWSKVTAFLDSTCSNHKSHVFPMFLPSSPHRKPQSAYSDSSSKASLPGCWNWMTNQPGYIFLHPNVWLVNFHEKKSSPNNIIKGNPRASGVSNNPSMASAPQVPWTDSVGMGWCKFLVLSVNLKHLSKCRLFKVADDLQNTDLLQICWSVVLYKFRSVVLNKPTWGSNRDLNLGGNHSGTALSPDRSEY